MIVARTQKLLEKIYRVSGGYHAADFLVTDSARALEMEGASDSARDVPEKLLVAEDEEGARLALYLDESVLERLRHRDPHTRIDEANLGDFWTVVEGISHFMYLTWRATGGRAVSLLELELQAEVDKYISTAMLAASQCAGRVPGNLHRILFEDHRIDPALDDEGRERYRVANRYAGKYCLRLARRFLRGPGANGLLAEIRAFYRLGQGDKLRHIDHGRLALA